MAEYKSTRGAWGKSPERRRAAKAGLRAQDDSEIAEGLEDVCWHKYDEDGYALDEEEFLPAGVTFDGSWAVDIEAAGDDAYSRMTDDNAELDIRTEGWDDGGTRRKRKP